MQIKRDELTVKLLKEYLHYDEETGVFTYIKKTGRKSVLGKPVGSISKRDGHLEIRFLGTLYRANRLAWFYMTGTWPKKHIDHKDHNELNNAWKNLRDVSQQENNMNMPMRKDNTSGVMGVWFRKDTNKWAAEIMVDKAKKSLGCYSTIEEATQVRKQAEIDYGFYENPGKA